ncbi:MAG: hypothetical protein C0412_10945 [Flavobacterium sp.]|nr:hypothetical protein [Flavobacterium sp.]
MTKITKEKCLEKICNLPLEFEVSDKSSVDLLLESKYIEFSREISQQEIKNYLLLHKSLIGDWKIWSENKRAFGYYLLINSDKYFIGSFDKDGNENFSKSFFTAEDACAEFILREVSVILELKLT